ncbi:hypothetical protein [Rhizobium sp. Leaf386]|uniref:hypothetical protein n=1 Tax=Rhizobium sp. Leaf386 TaxID=1736359 RepID=UPI000715706C|nr:hypothetical protein [Rhizobium sp. Leaf386]KQS95370.1 hypothetical protein ASG50_25430 [Rhizobium sp. Leaf386]
MLIHIACLLAGGAVGAGIMSCVHAGREQPPEATAPIIAAMLVVLRLNLRLLEDELQQRQFSGVPYYIEPVAKAVERTKNIVAQAEGWQN